MSERYHVYQQLIQPARRSYRLLGEYAFGAVCYFISAALCPFAFDGAVAVVSFLCCGGIGVYLFVLAEMELVNCKCALDAAHRWMNESR